MLEARLIDRASVQWKVIIPCMPRIDDATRHRQDVDANQHATENANSRIAGSSRIKAVSGSRECVCECELNSFLCPALLCPDGFELGFRSLGGRGDVRCESVAFWDWDWELGIWAFGVECRMMIDTAV